MDQQLWFWKSQNTTRLKLLLQPQKKLQRRYEATFIDNTNALSPPNRLQGIMPSEGPIGSSIPEEF
jgi:hypothetical protein